MRKVIEIGVYVNGAELRDIEHLLSKLGYTYYVEPTYNPPKWNTLEELEADCEGK